ncbi:multidrug ABC transporter permease [Gordoniibacillus kamchatkensis]|uniref:Multidrug ABC transporter permease n=1 Tax=Gordoniibacillus kamchatkensis TaxID=1590651 RepID=A0ABR5ADJ0_9BACL|nr:ABC transporter ATP-binding protein [Paenibacillus sp. VKM B-2647]KIL39104.1 multidrug ABC transporter permease [Paenibacillus sp. VKM B-2647]
MTTNRQTGRRLFQYAWTFRKPIFLALLLLAAAVCAELAGPLIAKRMIDNNILGIEKTWYETTGAGKYSVNYQGKQYIREDHVSYADSGQGKQVRVLQIGRKYVFLGGQLAFDGERTLSGSTLTVHSKDGREASYTVRQLSAGELFAFYRPEFGGMMTLAGAYFGLLLLVALFTFGQRYLLQTTANRIIQNMRNDVFAHIQKLPIQYFDNLPAGKVVSRITNDTEAVRELYVAVLANFFSGIIYMVAIIGALFLLDYRLALFAIPLVPLLYVWIIVYRRFAVHYNQQIRSRLSDINGMIAESIQGMPIIQAFRRQKETLREFGEMNDQHFRFQNKLLMLNSITSHNLVNVVRNVIFLAAIWMFGGGLLGAAITVGMLYAFVDYMNRMMQPIVGIVNQLSNMETAIVSAERVFELMGEPGIDVIDGTMPRYRGNVSFERVTFAYKGEEYVLRDISFEAKHGETVALVGHTGSGKSSILNLLFRFYEVGDGRILIDGRDLQQIPRQHLRHHMGIVLQDPFLFTGTIASNVSLNDPRITREQVEKALRDVGAYDMFAALPKGIDEPVIEKGATLSAGQRQLVSFARALAFNPAILILDEATASIDTETEAIIQAALDVLKKGRTTFIIAHRLSTIRSADRILVLDHGRIVERGNHDELMALRGRYYQMYLLQSGEDPSADRIAANMT